jgi:hypothetical protein
MGTAALLAAAAGLFFAPAEVAGLVRVRVVDAAAPGLIFGLRAKQRSQDAYERWRHADRKNPVSSAEEKSQTAGRELAFWKDRCRKLELAQVQLHDRLRQAERAAIPFRREERQPLLVPDVLEAAVIGGETASRWRAGKFVDQGEAGGLVRDSLVLESLGPLLDQGSEARVAVDQPVFAGRAVVGKIARVGHAVSSVQPVTDSSYRGGAQIYRRTADGIAAGPQGILAGQNGPLCLLTHIDATEAVNEGDEVYTASRDDLPYPLYYGTVAKAELQPGALQWDIWVKPASTADNLRSVLVLRSKLNPARMLGE